MFNMDSPPENSVLVDDDEHEDLFVSAIDQSQSRQTSQGTLKSSNNTMEDLNAVSDEIDLGDDNAEEEKNNEAEKTGSEEPSGPESMVIKGSSSVPPFSKSNGDDKSSQSSVAGPLSNMSSMKATIDASCTTANPSEGLGFKSVGSIKRPTTDLDNTRDEESDTFIEIKVRDPQKVGDGMGSYVCYKVTTHTNLPFFRKSLFTVSRRFSDFLGLREKLAEKHIHAGHIVPPAPEKDAVNNAKVIMSKEDSTSSEFLEKRAASLERFLNRVAQHPILQVDPNFREFLELESDLPKAKSTSALSGAGVRRLFNRMGDTVSKITFRMDETDPWFEEKQHQIDLLDQQLRKLHASIEGLIHFRKELTVSTGLFAKSAAMLGNCEEHTALSCALSQLAETHEKIEQLHADQANNDFYHLSEPLRDYIALIGVVKELFHQRVKVYQTWQHAQQMLNKKRQIKTQHDLVGKGNPQDQEEIIEWEAKVNRGQEEFDQISRNIKKEIDKFELNRVKDFKTTFIKYMECLLNDQQQLIKYWEAFLPEAKAIS